MRLLTELDVTGHAEQDVIALDVSVDDAVRVQVAETLCRLSAYGSNLSLGHDVAGHHIGKTTALHVLHDDPKISLVEERIDVVDNVGMARRLHDQNLVDNEVLLRLLFKVHLLDGHRDIGPELVSGVDTPRSTIGGPDRQKCASQKQPL